MTIVQLEYLLSVADNGSFSAAADYCHVTQPSLSVQIKNLEEELGVVLLNRNEKPLTLTAMGSVVAEQAREAISDFHSIGQKVNDAKKEVAGTLRLAVIPTIAPYILHLFLPKFIKRYPKVEVEIKEMFTRDIAVALRRGTVDIGILAGGFLDSSEVDEEILYKDKFYLYVSPDSPLRGRQWADVKDLDLDNLLLLADGHCLRSQVLDLCKVARLSGRAMNFESGSLETIVRMVSTTGGMTIVPEMATPYVSDKSRDCLISFKESLGATRDITIAVDKNFYKKAIYKALKNEILEMHKMQYFLI
ncbi:MAG: LysR substrate-binding domain-containing protein [Rikenellaceae bacterium]